MSALLCLGTEGASQLGPGCSAEGRQCQASYTPKTQDRSNCSVHTTYSIQRVKVLSYFTQLAKTLAVIP